MNTLDTMAGVFMGFVLAIFILLVSSMLITTNFEKCSARYTTSDEVVECMWLLENN